MNALSYLLTLVNMKAAGGPYHQLKDVAVNVGTVDHLKDVILHTPGFSAENFKYNSYHRVGLLGLYASNTVRQYMLEGKGNPDDEGLVLNIYYEPIKENQSSKSSEFDEFPGIFIRGKDVSEQEGMKILRSIKLNGPGEHKVSVAHAY
ncbi:uncharacterized protein LOC142973864 [Anticarsia gemmatalis]|uniref:uncharacterized protein LOC142973864 n=1 Tax=Anticarsia gemmatalis TaxID=129554 RepID=UPI003F76372B